MTIIISRTIPIFLETLVAFVTSVPNFLIAIEFSVANASYFSRISSASLFSSFQLLVANLSFPVSCTSKTFVIIFSRHVTACSTIACRCCAFSESNLFKYLFCSSYISEHSLNLSKYETSFVIM